MAFDPLETDEVNPNPKVPVQDFDAHMLGGCSAFVWSSFLTYFLGIWPFFAFQKITTFGELATAVGLGLFCTGLFSAYVSRRFGTAGWFGSLGGTMAISMFTYLRLDTVQFLTLEPGTKPPEFSSWLTIAIALGWIAIIGLVGWRLQMKSKDAL